MSAVTRNYLIYFKRQEERERERGKNNPETRRMKNDIDLL